MTPPMKTFPSTKTNESLTLPNPLPSPSDPASYSLGATRPLSGANGGRTRTLSSGTAGMGTAFNRPSPAVQPQPPSSSSSFKTMPAVEMDTPDEGQKCQVPSCTSSRVSNKLNKAVYPELCRPCALSVSYRLNHGQNFSYTEAVRDQSKAIASIDPATDSPTRRRFQSQTVSNFKCIISACKRTDQSNKYPQLCTACAASWGKVWHQNSDTSPQAWSVRRSRYLE